MILKEYSSPNSAISMDYFKDNPRGTKIHLTADKLHYHNYNEISFIIKGNVTYVTKNNVSKAINPCVLFSRAQEMHNLFVDQNQMYERFQISFHDNAIDSILTDNAILNEAMKFSYIKQINERDFIKLLEGVKNLHSTIQKQTTDQSTEIQKALQLILLIISSHNAKPIGTQIETNYINDVIDYIKNNYHTQLTLGSIASNFFISKSKLIYDFKNYCNMSLLEYITLTKIEFAKEYLLKGYSVAATAEKCGFSSSSYFIKIFSKFTNTTPLKFQTENVIYDEISKTLV